MTNTAKTSTLLLELFTEELPARSLSTIVNALQSMLLVQFDKAGWEHGASQVYAAPRRIAVTIENLASQMKDQMIERKGPACSQAFTSAGEPTPALKGFAKSCGITVEALMAEQSENTDWIMHRQMTKGKSIVEWLPAVLKQVLDTLPLPKRMRWGNGSAEFLRPIHAITLLYGDAVIPANLFGIETGRVTRGHRFDANHAIEITQASAYESILLELGKVIVDANKRRARMLEMISTLCQQSLPAGYEVKCDDALVDEVCGLVEYPYAYLGQFDEAFLSIPEEVLISSMQDHQRYFPVFDANKHLAPYFVVISHIESKDPAQLIEGNQRVLRARLADAAFFYEGDQKTSLLDATEKLKGIVFQAKLGTLYAKAERMREMAVTMSELMNESPVDAARAAFLAKADLVSQLVGEFPELQGKMGYYYALHDGESSAVAEGIQTHYYPRFSGDKLPATSIAKVVSLADRLDTLVGAFSVGLIPTGDKDPFALRRAALGVIRIIIEGQCDLSLLPLLEKGYSLYAEVNRGHDKQSVIEAVWHFILERFRIWLSDQSITSDIFYSVSNLNVSNLLDMYRRIQAVSEFKTSEAALSLSAANKRVSNILSKYTASIARDEVDVSYFEANEEAALADALKKQEKQLDVLLKDQRYRDGLMALAELHQPVDAFFDKVMVMAEDERRRENRILLLKQLRTLFLRVADIAVLQIGN